MKRIAKTFRAVLAGIALILLASCGDNAKQERASELEVTVMEIHDEAMAQMGEVTYLIDTLTVLLDQVELQDSLPDTGFVAELKRCITQLEEADEAMMSWMRNYDPPAEEMKVEDKIDYLKGEKEKVVAVQDQFNRSISGGKACLEKAENR